MTLYSMNLNQREKQASNPNENHHQCYILYKMYNVYMYIYTMNYIFQIWASNQWLYYYYYDMNFE